MKFADNINVQDRFNTSLGRFEHRYVPVSDLFPDKYYQITQNYIGKLEMLQERYDVIIFMARKAICFYKALVINGEISFKSNCKVYSSRILDYNVLDNFVDKKIALVDDVVIKGLSLEYATKILKGAGLSFDIYVAAISDKAYEDYREAKVQSVFKGYFHDICQPVVLLNENDLYSYASYITRYIEASMLPYNIDQPIISLDYGSQEELKDFYIRNKTTDITSAVQKNYGIVNCVIHFKGSMLESFLESTMKDYHTILVKIRVFHDQKSCQLVLLPIVLLPILTKSQIDALYAKIGNEQFNELIQNRNPAIVYENKLKLINYVLGTLVLEAFCDYEIIANDKLVIKWFDSNENILFASDILGKVFGLDNYRISSKGVSVYNLERNLDIDKSTLLEYLGFSYACIFSKDENNDRYEYRDAVRKPLKTTIITHQKLLQLFQSLAKRKMEQKKYSPFFLKYAVLEEFLVSNVIDILIDRGTLVPTIVHSRNGELVRAFKCGEIAKLTEIEFNLFGYMLSKYVSQRWENGSLLPKDEKDCYIEKHEFEKICVLFFKKATYEDNFEKIKGIDSKLAKEDYYSVYYTLYGPVVSVHDSTVHDALLDNNLSTTLQKYMYIKDFKGGIYYKVNNNQSCSFDRSLLSLVDNFVYDMLLLKHAYTNCQCMGTKNQMYRVRAFTDLLTLLSVGENEQQRILSLISEVKIISELRLMDTWRMIAYLNGNLHRIVYGIWLGKCYKDKNFLASVIGLISDKRNPLEQRFIQRIFEDYTKRDPRVDRNPQIERFLEDCNKFFYKVYFNVSAINARYPSPSECAIKDSAELPVHLENDTEYASLKRSINNDYDKSCEGTERYFDSFITEQFLNLKKQAITLVDICDLYLERSAFGYKKNMYTLLLCLSSKSGSPIPQSFSIGCIELDYRTNSFFEIYEGQNHTSLKLFSLRDDYSNESLAVLMKNVLENLSMYLSPSSNKDINKDRVFMVLYIPKNWHESIISSNYVARGRCAERILADVVYLESNKDQSCPVELIVCGDDNGVIKDIKSDYFTITPGFGHTEVLDDYTIIKYGIKYNSEPRTSVNYVTNINNAEQCNFTGNDKVHIDNVGTGGTNTMNVNVGNSSQVVCGNVQNSTLNNNSTININEIDSLEELHDDLVKLKVKLDEIKADSALRGKVDEALIDIQNENRNSLKEKFAWIKEHGLNIIEGMASSVLLKVISGC